jgi:hypothetical protein
MTCLAAGGAFSYAGSGDSGVKRQPVDDRVRADAEQAQKVAESAASARVFLQERIRRQIAEEQAEAIEFGDEQMTAAATAACELVAEGLIKSLVWHASVTISAASMHGGGASLILTDKNLSRRSTIVIDREGAAGAIIRTGTDNVTTSEKFDPLRASDYLKWFS